MDADLLAHDLLKASYIPDKDQRKLWEISIYIKSLVEERARARQSHNHIYIYI